MALGKEIQQLFTETLFSTNLTMKFSRMPAHLYGLWLKFGEINLWKYWCIISHRFFTPLQIKDTFFAKCWEERWPTNHPCQAIPSYVSLKFQKVVEFCAHKFLSNSQSIIRHSGLYQLFVSVLDKDPMGWKCLPFVNKHPNLRSPWIAVKESSSCDWMITLGWCDRNISK